jgi:nucleoside 2-deoxyribosyltransferase
MTKSNAQPTAGSPVYCSGPMFSHGDKWEQHAIATALEGAKFTTYLPQRDGIEVGRVMGLLNHPLLEGTPIAQHVMLDVRKWVFALDMFQLLERCQSLVFNLDGRTPDDGSVVETAAAFAAGKPIVIFKTTPITMLAGADNPMVEGLSTSWSYVDKAADVPKAVATAVAGMAKQPYAYAGPPNVAALMGEGKEVWDVLEGLRALPKETPEQWIEWLLKIAEELLGGGKSKRFERKTPVSEGAQTPG